LKLLFLYTIFNLSFSTQAEAQQRDFGPTGIEGLSVEQLVKLYNGSILFLTTDPAKSGGTSSLTEAAVMFTVPPETAWKLISKTVDQPKYIDGCIEVKVIHTSPGTSYEVRKVGNFMVTYTYGVIQNFLPEKKCLYWSLDTTYAENDLNSLHGIGSFILMLMAEHSAGMETRSHLKISQHLSKRAA